MSRPNKTKQIAFRVTPEEERYLEKEADERNLNVSEYIRALALPPGIVIPTNEKPRA